MRQAAEELKEDVSAMEANYRVDAEPFLRAICDNPDDDALRLTYADWLEEHDNAARAEFIRVQCEMERNQARWEELERREQELLAKNEASWRHELPRVPGLTWHDFTRGFVEEATVEAQAQDREGFLHDAGPVFTATPLQSLTILGLNDGEANQLARLSVLRHLRNLTLSPPDPRANLGLFRDVTIGDDGAVSLAESPHLVGLVSLRLAFNHISDRGRYHWWPLRIWLACPCWA